jgi:hypothetical protein
VRRVVQAALTEVYRDVVESVGRYHHEFLAATVRMRAGLIICMAKLDPQAKLPQLSALKKAAVPCLYIKFKDVPTQKKYKNEITHLYAAQRAPSMRLHNACSAEHLHAMALVAVVHRLRLPTGTPIRTTHGTLASDQHPQVFVPEIFDPIAKIVILRKTSTSRGNQKSNEPTVVAYHFLLRTGFWVAEDLLRAGFRVADDISAVFGPGKSCQSSSSPLRSTDGPLGCSGGWSSMICTSARRPSEVKLPVRAVEGVEAGSLSVCPNDWSEKMFLPRFLEPPPRCVEVRFMRKAPVCTATGRSLSIPKCKKKNPIEVLQNTKKKKT